MFMYGNHDGRLDMHECKLIVIQAYQDTNKVRSTTTFAKSEKFKDMSKVTHYKETLAELTKDVRIKMW